MKQLSMVCVHAARMSATIPQDQQAAVVAFLKACLEDDNPHPLKAVFDAINSKLGDGEIPNPIEFEIGDYVEGRTVEAMCYRESSVMPWDQVTTLNYYGAREDKIFSAASAISAGGVPPYDQRLSSLTREAAKLRDGERGFQYNETELKRLYLIANGDRERLFRSIVSMTAEPTVIKMWPIERVEQAIMDDEEFIARLWREYVAGDDENDK